MAARNPAALFTYGQMAHKLSPFVQELLKSEPRFRFTDVGNDYFDDKKFFVVEKDHIYMPTALPTAEHEIAHAVEMSNKARWLLPDWGLAFGAKWDKDLTPRVVFAAMSREVRVRAIELHMTPEERNDKRSTKYNILNNDHAWGYWAKRYTPFGRFKNYADVHAWVSDLREKTYNAWSLERIRHEWMIRLAHFQNYMETKKAA